MTNDKQDTELTDTLELDDLDLEQAAHRTWLLERAEDLSDRLSEIQATGLDTQALKLRAEHAQFLKKQLDTRLERLKTPYSLVFMGAVGCGKSSAIGVLAGALVSDQRPTTQKELVELSVMAVGAGRTSLCEVILQAATAPLAFPLDLTVEGMSKEAVTEELTLYAQDIWRRTRPQPPARSGEDLQSGQDQEARPFELERALRNLTGYPETKTTRLVNGRRITHLIKPIEDAARSFSTEEEFVAHLVARAELDSRQYDGFNFSTDTPDQRRELRECFQQINEGKAEGQPLPRRLLLSLPRLPFPHELELTLHLVDSRGLEVSSRLDLREDLMKHAQNEQSVLIFCAPFKDAPGELIFQQLKVMSQQPDLEGTLARTRLLLLDHNDAAQVIGAEGDRETGQAIRLEQCARSLEPLGTHPALKGENLLVFDALQDEPEPLRGALWETVKELHMEHLDTLRTLCEEGLELTEVIDQTEVLPRQEEVDAHVRQLLQKHPLPTQALQDPLKGLYDALLATRSGPVIHAACRRNGAYWPTLQLYFAIELHAWRAAWAVLTQALAEVTEYLEEEKVSQPLIVKHLDFRLAEFKEGIPAAAERYSKGVREECEVRLKNDQKLWTSCRREWGQGPGYRERVLEHLRAWAQRQPPFESLSKLSMDDVALVAELELHQTPPVILTVRNLRILKEVQWALDGVCLLIGANGTGKSTLVQTLRLLRLAYELGLPEAISVVLGGSNNLINWDCSSDAAVTVSLALGDLTWSLTLVPRDGSVAFNAHESLSRGERTIFTKDALGNLVFQGRRLRGGPWPLTGLRTLTDRGVESNDLKQLVSLVKGLSVFAEADLYSIRMGGAHVSDRHSLDLRSKNVAAVLRSWTQDRDQVFRSHFVVEGLKTAFPHQISDLDFKEEGQTVVVRMYRPGSDRPGDLRSEANGVLQLLALLCNVAQADEGGVVAIDEPETALHPSALQIFFRWISRWAVRWKLKIVLATHSTVLLNELMHDPERIFVFERSGRGGGPELKRLTELKSRQWLEDFAKDGFSLGEQFGNGNLGSNLDGSLE